MRDDYFVLTMVAMRGVADVAALSDAAYRLWLVGLVAALKVTIQRRAHNTAAAVGPGRGASRMWHGRRAEPRVLRLLPPAQQPDMPSG